jgi:hypothetical protein
MQANTENINWNWSDELDALTAAPAHHKLIMENDFVRVLDTYISPGDITPIHTHRNPASLYIISCTILSDMMNMEMFYLIQEVYVKHRLLKKQYGQVLCHRMH